MGIGTWGGLGMAPFLGRTLMCWVFITLITSLLSLPSCDLQRPSRLCQLVLEHIEQSEKGHLEAAHLEGVNLDGAHDELLLQSLSALLKGRNGAGSVKEVEKRRNHNDNDPGHVFLRFGRQAG